MAAAASNPTARPSAAPRAASPPRSPSAEAADVDGTAVASVTTQLASRVSGGGRSPGGDAEGGRAATSEGDGSSALATAADKADFKLEHKQAELPNSRDGTAATPAQSAEAHVASESESPLRARSWWHEGFHTEDPSFVMTQRFHVGYFMRELMFQGLGSLAIPIVLAWDGKNAAINRALFPRDNAFWYQYFSSTAALQTLGCALSVVVFFIADDDDLPTMYSSEFFWVFMCFMLRGVAISTKYGLFSAAYRRRLKEEVIDESEFGGTMLLPAWGSPTPDMIDYRLRESTYRLGLDPRLLKFHVPAAAADGHHGGAASGGIMSVTQDASASATALEQPKDLGNRRDVTVPRGSGTAGDAAKAVGRFRAKAVHPSPSSQTAPVRASTAAGTAMARAASDTELLRLKHGPLPNQLNLKMAPCGCCLCHSEAEAVLAARPDVKYVEVDAMREANLIAQSAFNKTLPSLNVFVWTCAVVLGCIPSFVRVHEGKPFFGAGGLDTLGIVSVFISTSIMLVGITGWAVVALLDAWRRLVALHMHSELGASIALFSLPPTRPRVDSSWLRWYSRFEASVDFPRWASFSSTCPTNVHTWLHLRRILLDTGGHFAYRTHFYVGYYVAIVLGVVGYVLFRVAQGESAEGVVDGEATLVIATVDLALSGLVLGVLSVTILPTLVMGWYANESLRQRDAEILTGHKFGAQVRLRNSRTPYDAHGEMNDTIDAVVEVLERDRSMRPGKVMGLAVSAAVLSSIGSTMVTGLVVVLQLVTGFTCWGLCGGSSGA